MGRGALFFVQPRCVGAEPKGQACYATSSALLNLDLEAGVCFYVEKDMGALRTMWLALAVHCVMGWHCEKCVHKHLDFSAAMRCGLIHCHLARSGVAMRTLLGSMSFMQLLIRGESLLVVSD